MGQANMSHETKLSGANGDREICSAEDKQQCVQMFLKQGCWQPYTVDPYSAISKTSYTYMCDRYPLCVCIIPSD